MPTHAAHAWTACRRAATRRATWPATWRASEIWPAREIWRPQAIWLPGPASSRRKKRRRERRPWGRRPWGRQAWARPAWAQRQPYSGRRRRSRSAPPERRHQRWRRGAWPFLCEGGCDDGWWARGRAGCSTSRSDDPPRVAYNPRPAPLCPPPAPCLSSLESRCTSRSLARLAHTNTPHKRAHAHAHAHAA